MKTWQKLSADYNNDGFVVSCVDSLEGLQNLGNTLRNGLVIPEARKEWGRLCREGFIQIVSVVDVENGNRLVANAELRIRNGVLMPIFVRGVNNFEFTAENREYRAVTDYINAVFNRNIEVFLGWNGQKFDLPENANKETPWQTALRVHQEYGVTPFEALNMGLGLEPAPAQMLDPDFFQEKTWTPLTAPVVSTLGYTIEMVSSRTGLRTVANNLESSLFLPTLNNMVAERAVQGAVQYAVIYGQDGLLGTVEFNVVSGQLVPVSARGQNDEPLTREVQTAVVEFTRLVNGGEHLKLNLQLVGNRFYSLDANLDDVEILGTSATSYVGPTLPEAQRSAPMFFDAGEGEYREGVYAIGYDGEDEEEEEEEEDDNEDGIYVVFGS